MQHKEAPDGEPSRHGLAAQHQGLRTMWFCSSSANAGSTWIGGRHSPLAIGQVGPTRRRRSTVTASYDRSVCRHTLDAGNRSTYAAFMATVLSVNVGRAQPTEHSSMGVTGIDKRPMTGAVDVRAPGAKQDGLGSGLVGDAICDRRHHGGNDQAVYAYARGP
jgi:hypothetical protein